MEDRARLREQVGVALDKIERGLSPTDAEREHVDLKEEAGRRGKGGLLLPGEPRNLAAADQLADEVACMANTPGGGALIVGVDDDTGALLGAALDAEWLRHRIYERVDIAPTVETVERSGVRLLVLYVAAAREPVENTNGQLRWRTGRQCVPVDRAEWWLHRDDIAGHDPMAAVTDRTIADVASGAIEIARRYLDEQFRYRRDEPVTGSAEELLTMLGVRRPDGRLTQAGVLLFCPANRTYLSLSVLDVEGGDVILAPTDMTGLSLLEQIAAVEDRLDTLNTAITLRSGFSETPVRRLPQAAVREALLNAVAHRDWMQPEPVAVTFVEVDSALQVVSPGGFVGGVGADNLLTERFARYPALADLLRAMRLVEKQGLGVDRMYRDMIALGHRPPVIVEDAGPRVRVRLKGGQPVVPVMRLLSAIKPEVRQRDVRVALIVWTLLHHPFVVADDLTDVLQRSEPEVVEALDTAADCRVGEQSLIARYKDVCVLSDSALRVVDVASSRPLLRRRGVLTYRRPDDGESIVRRWLRVHDRYTTRDHAVLTGLSHGGARYQLLGLHDSGIIERGEAMGRNAHYVAGPAIRSSTNDDRADGTHGARHEG